MGSRLFFEAHMKLFLNAIKQGNSKTRLSFLIPGFSCFAHKQFVRGFIFLISHILLVLFFIFFGFERILGLKSLGTQTQEKIFSEARGIYIYTQGDNSMLFLLFGVLSILVFIGLCFLYYLNIRNAYKNQLLKEEGKDIPLFKTDVDRLLNAKYHVTVLSLPLVLTILFTVLPLIFMILIAFTNFDQNHQPPGNLFTWVGLDNFLDLFYNNKIISNTFFSLLQWTFVWAFFATFLNYIFGMLLAILINSKAVHLKKMWRTFFVMTIAIPQFVSLLLMSKLLADQGTINQVLMKYGFDFIPFLTHGTVAKITVIIVNLWVGVPYTMLITSGILMNIPQEMYEAARIDGAGPIKQFYYISLPYMLSVTAPYLITQFVGNINNFNVIYLLTGGGPLTLKYFQAGETDLLVTWLYKLTVNNKDYSIASAIGIIIFVISATISLVIFGKVTKKGREGTFQ